MTEAGVGARLPLSKVAFGRGAFVAESAKLGYPSEKTINAWLLEPELAELRPVMVGEKSIVLDGVVVQEGARIGNDCFVGHSVHIGFDCLIGDACRFEYSARVCDRVSIGTGCVVGGFVCDGSTIGDDCVVLGSLVHGMREPDLPWGQYEPDPVLEQRVFVGFGAVVVGGARVGTGSYVAANATVTKDVPPDHVAINTNEFVPIRDWPGKLDRKR
jgi:acetyltransferase-like isoleucine patch superfamily enzyme